MEWDRIGKDIDVMSGRAASRANALANLKKSATKIKAPVEKRAMKEKIMELREVVHIPLKDMDWAWSAHSIPCYCRVQ